MPLKNIFLIYKAVIVTLTAATQLSCSNETPEQTKKRYQREYEQNFKTTICTVMEVYVESYKEDPFNNTFGIQGYTTYDEVIQMLFEHSKSLMKARVYGHGYPKDFAPDPIFPSVDDIQKNCPKNFKLFWQIPI